MARYFLGVNHSKQRKFLKKSRVIIIALILLLFIGLIAIAIDAFLERQRAQTPSQPTKAVVSTIAPSIEVFTTPYFQFQTDKNWRFIANESSSTKFVYRRGTTNLVSGDMTVYINSKPPDTQATRVLPVSLNEEKNSLNASFVSNHCREKLPKAVQQTQGESPTILQTVNFLCDVDGTQFTIIVGLENGTPAMKFSRPDGTAADYLIYFKDLRATPVASEFQDIMNSFQIR